MRELNYDGCRSEVEYRGYIAELAMKQQKHAARSPDAVRQAKVERHRRIARKYFEVWLRNGARPLSWLVVDGRRISKTILSSALLEMVEKFPVYAEFRGVCCEKLRTTRKTHAKR